MRRETLMNTLLAGAGLLCGCGDLAREADRVPTELLVSPDSGLLTVGEPAKLEVLVKDQNGETMPVPGWARPVWEVSDDSVAEISRDGTLTGMKGGRVAVTARFANLTADARFRMNPEKLLLTAPVIYLTQAAQNRTGTVRLIGGRSALLRVFVVGEQVNWLEPPSIQVSLLQDDSVVFERLLPPGTDHVPTGVDESSLPGSFNVEIPGSVIQPGVRMVVEIDPEGLFPLAPGSQVRYPAEASKALDIVEPPLFRMILVPTLALVSPDSSVLAWTDGVNADSEQMRLARNILPAGAMEVEVHETYTTTADFRGGGWFRFLNEIEVLYEDEGRRGYYYGAVGSSVWGLRGLANLGYPVSVGVDVDHVYTHEVGHTMNLDHAPCGGARGPDPDFPYSGGSIGVWGYDIAGSQLLDPGRYKDVMSYCFDQIWISDYQFDRALTHRLNGDGGIDHDAEPASSGLGQNGVLVVWGGIWGGDLKLDAAFVLDGPVVLPEADGPYRVKGVGAGGETRFSISFSPTPLSDGGGSFVFLIPYEPEWAENLDRMVLTGPEGEYTVTRDGEPEMAVVTDRSTGRIQAIIRNWDGGPLPGEGSVEVTITRGIPVGGVR